LSNHIDLTLVAGMVSAMVGGAESPVAREMASAGERDLYSWKGNTAEVEFLHVLDEGVCPVEVKAGNREHSKSAGVFASRNQSPVVLNLGSWNYHRRGRTCFLPLYATVFFLPLIRFPPSELPATLCHPRSRVFGESTCDEGPAAAAVRETASTIFGYRG
jgi:hypothetical protein